MALSAGSGGHVDIAELQAEPMDFVALPRQSARSIFGWISLFTGKEIDNIDTMYMTC